MKNQFKKVICVLLILCLLLSLAACGGEQSGGEQSNGAEASDGSGVSESGNAVESDPGSVSQPAEIVQYVKDAMEAADRLTTGNYFLLEDGSVLTMEDTKRTFAAEYAALPDLKMIIDSSSEMELFALTESGEVYYHDTKIMDGIIDGAYNTTNVNQSIIAVTEDAIYNLYVTDSPNEALRKSAPDNYTDVMNKTVVHSQRMPGKYRDLSTENGDSASGPFAGVSAEKGDYFILTADGRVFTDSEDYAGMSFFTWQNIAVFATQKRMLTSLNDDKCETEITVAAILADGTVMAEGTYAEEILSWGELSYITMSDSLIVGLTSDGVLKVTGSAAEYVESDLADWQNIVAVKVSGTSKVERMINALDSDGNCYQLKFDSRWSENSIYIVSPEDGITGEFTACYKYCPDGGVYRTSSEGSWEPYED